MAGGLEEAGEREMREAKGWEEDRNISQRWEGLFPLRNGR